MFSEWLFSTFKILYVNTTQNRFSDKKKVNFIPQLLLYPSIFPIFQLSFGKKTQKFVGKSENWTNNFLLNFVNTLKRLTEALTDASVKDFIVYFLFTYIYAPYCSNASINNVVTSFGKILVRNVPEQKIFKIEDVSYWAFHSRIVCGQSQWKNGYVKWFVLSLQKKNLFDFIDNKDLCKNSFVCLSI